MTPFQVDATAIAAAAEELRRGGLVAFPTETVYGLGADARNPLALRQVFAAKGRPADHPLIVHLARAEDRTDWALEDPRAAQLARAFWPGPLTLILPRQPGVPDEVTGGLPTVGLRVPDHPVAQALLRAFGGGIAAPSANHFGRVSPTTSAHVRAELGPDLLVLEGGPCRVGLESTIVDLSGPEAAILRPGAITAAQISACIGPLGGPTGTVAPGTLASHYAPHTALLIAADVDAAAEAARAQGRTVALLRAGPPEDHARRLYAELRRLDQLGVDLLIAEPSADPGLGLAVNDRLARAARREEA